MATENAELRAVLHRWINSVGLSDWDTVVNLLSPTDELRYVGTDDSEWWSGSEVAQVFGRHMQEMPEFRLDVDLGDVEAFSKGPVGWGRGRGTARFEGMEPFMLRTTAVFVLDSGVWRAIQVHNSLGRANLDVMGAELTTTLDGLLRSIESTKDEEGLARAHEGTVTLVFTDIEDSTGLAASVGDPAWAELIAWHDNAIRTSTEAEGGTVIKTLGDGAMLSFTSARAAARSAIEIQRTVSTAKQPVKIRIRIGIHAGDVVRTEEDVLGHTVNKAARIASSAAGGEIRTSNVIYAMLADSHEFRFGEAVDVSLKGLDGVHTVVPLEWE